ncbi:MAG: phosphoribosylanthranilate isomerase [Proteobacteria bacterium]|nr:phosphoribosylanthranilate isomerase [Pseudomonadota bacterium]MDA0861504.1 phosphoribosylanthranilate isomerase [Pseudomonadota bacterium]MDA1031175.1 phosphoribosylanthranilate isomerase [Pseudomonadota bacterium]
MNNNVTAIKICGLTSVENALEVAQSGVSAIGLIFYPESPRNVSLDIAKNIVESLPPFVSAVGLFVDPSLDEVFRTLESVDLHVLQFHGGESSDFCSKFKKPYLKATHVSAEVDLVEYAKAYKEASGLLLDTFSEKVRGGTGDTFDWNLVPTELDVPIVLAGGLRPDNVAAAIDRVGPWAVDVSSGVEGTQKGVKDLALVRDFIGEVKNADARRFTKL